MRLNEAVVVITGASSGIGRATAHAFARRGARVVVAARRPELLDEAVRECEGLDAEALAVPTDVTDPFAVERLADAAEERFGRIDVWVNNAGVTAMGRFEEVPPEVFRQVIETNFFGYVHGARTALLRFRARKAGLLINNASMNAYVAEPFASAYVASKFAIRGLSDSLREEWMDEPGIRICTVLPGVIDTPLFQHAANYEGRPVKAMAPVYPAERVAETIVRLAERPRREAFVGNSGRMLTLQRRLAPAMTERMMARMVDRQHFRQNERAVVTRGNLFEPVGAEDGVTGGWRAPARQRHPLAWGLGALALGLGVAALAARSGRGPFAGYGEAPRDRFPGRYIRPADPEALRDSVRRPREEVDEPFEGSFPASDPPAYQPSRV
ncbi:SDR family oxidoreductase [Azospirillum sp. SYSU D00513]|uniref:SDR family oxidoreductase n=1 Tax=Azospirillum sp. SYSU D00513 TaxID=2812561 RepID=UPI001A974736